MKRHPTDGAMVLARWKHEGMTESQQIMSEKPTALAETQTIGSISDVTGIPDKSKRRFNDQAERKRHEKALDDAIENTFPASDPVSAEQPV